jgi:hypothetical protein
LLIISVVALFLKILIIKDLKCSWLNKFTFWIILENWFVYIKTMEVM